MAPLTAEGRSTTARAADARYRRVRPRSVLDHQQDLQYLFEQPISKRAAEAPVVLDPATVKFDESPRNLVRHGDPPTSIVDR